VTTKDHHIFIDADGKTELNGPDGTDFRPKQRQPSDRLVHNEFRRINAKAFFAGGHVLKEKTGIRI
jgi:hypothetical protein